MAGSTELVLVLWHAQDETRPVLESIIFALVNGHSVSFIYRYIPSKMLFRWPCPHGFLQTDQHQARDYLIYLADKMSDTSIPFLDTFSSVP
jgi:hypothetical protein